MVVYGCAQNNDRLSVKTKAKRKICFRMSGAQLVLRIAGRGIGCSGGISRMQRIQQFSVSMY